MSVLSLFLTPLGAEFTRKQMSVLSLFLTPLG
jgi:hypothetical protein